MTGSSEQSPNVLELLRSHLETESHKQHGMEPRCRGAHRCDLHVHPPFVCVSCDRSYLFSQNDPKPDCLIATKHPRRPETWLWVVVEMTVDQKEPEEILKQLRAGVAVLESNGLLTLVAGELLLLYVEGRGRRHVAKRTALDRGRRQIMLYGARLPVFTAACNAHLTTVIDEIADLRASATKRRRAREPS